MGSHMKTASIEFFVEETSDMLVGRENTSDGKGGMVASEEVLRLSLSDVRAREPADIQRSIGRLVLSFLDSRSSKGLNFPRDFEDEKKLDEEHFDQLLEAANSNNPEAIYDLAVGLIARGMSNNSWADIQQGEVFLNQAVAAGLPTAITYQVETWALIRPRLEQKLRPSGANSEG